MRRLDTTEGRLEKARTLGEYECRVKELNDEELLVTFDSMTSLLFSLRDESSRDLAANGLDIVANEMYKRKLKKAH